MPEARPYELRYYVDEKGGAPVLKWLKGLRDTRTRRRIENRIARIELGNLGDHRRLDTELYELRLHFGPGFRVYFALEKNRVVLLLLGGDKRSQEKDIEQARSYFADYKRRSYGEDQ